MRINKIDKHAAARLLVLIQEMITCKAINEILLDHEGTEAGLEVKHWWTLYKAGKNVWRIKVKDPKSSHHRGINDYRIVYCYTAAQYGMSSRYYVLAVLHRREFNYDEHSEITKRIIRDYDEVAG